MSMTTIGHRTIDWQNFFANDSRQVFPVSAPQPFVPSSGWSGANFWKWPGESENFLLKIWPAEGPEARQHLFRHSQLNNLRDLDLPLGLPVPDRTGRTLRPWSDGLWAEVIPWFGGSPATVSPEPAQVASVVQVLCELHQRWTETTASRTGPSSAVLNRLNQLKRIDLTRLLSSRADFLQKGLNLSAESMEKLWEICRLAQLLRDDAVSLLQPFENEKFRILTILRDARPDQFLFHDGRLSGVIDFGAVGRDIIAVDLSRLATEWFPEDLAQQDYFVRSYVKNRIVDEREFRLIRPLALSGAILGGLAWLDLHFRKGRSIGREEEFERAIDHALSRLISFHQLRH